MPEHKYVKDPGHAVLVLDVDGLPIDLLLYLGRQVKRSRRKGAGVLAILGGPDAGRPGVGLLFESPADYELCIERVWLKPGGPR